MTPGTITAARTPSAGDETGDAPANEREAPGGPMMLITRPRRCAARSRRRALIPATTRR